MTTRREIKVAESFVPRMKMTASHRALIEIWMLDVERRMIDLSMRCQERVQR